MGKTDLGEKPEIVEMASKNCLLVFVRLPEKGKVKSRLAAAVGEENACHLYRSFVSDLLSTVSGPAASGAYALELFYDPPEQGRAVRAWLGEEYICRPQEGADLGERMGNALAQSFARGFRKAILIGSDIPDLPAEIIAEGFSRLETNDAVIGPSPDGGYYLIGFRSDRFSWRMFQGISWGSDRVFKKTMDFFASLDYRTFALPLWRDIDNIEDLRDLRDRGHALPPIKYQDDRLIL